MIDFFESVVYSYTIYDQTTNTNQKPSRYVDDRDECRPLDSDDSFGGDQVILGQYIPRHTAGFLMCIL
jgi:hypothetical protein